MSQKKLSDNAFAFVSSGIKGEIPISDLCCKYWKLTLLIIG